MQEAMNRYKKVKGVGNDPILEDYLTPQSYNNLVAKVSFGGKYYAVKSYKLPHEDDTKPIQGRSQFLDYCSKFTDVTNIPVLEAKYEDISCSILSWIDELIKLKI